jgi:hypothetical protein
MTHLFRWTSYRQRRGHLIATVVLLTSFILGVPGCAVLMPGLDNRYAISLREAVQLTPFAVCLPTYLPPDTDPSPLINYHADTLDDERELEFRYYHRTTHELVFTLEQAYKPNLTNEMFLSGYLDSKALQLGWWVRTETETTIAQEQMRSAETILQTPSGQRGVVELVEPAEVRATLVTWVQGKVLYALYTQLPADESTQIAQSIGNCIAPPTATP